ncbi:UNVERIFIED_CONTAM: hypothetical protein GTU68_022745 [Idotea baltica]|nr:hypothetical protein [Idotea baltica]
MFRLFKKKKPKDESIEIEKIVEDEVLEVEEELVTESDTDESLSIESENTEKVPENIQAEQVTEEQAPAKEVAEIIEKVEEPVVETQVEKDPQEKPEKKGLFQRLKSGLAKTSSTLTEGMSSLVLGKKKIDEDVLEELETRLLMADVGMEATQRIINDLTQRSSRNELNDVDALMAALNQEMVKILKPVSKPLDLEGIEGPAVVLMVGINGAGKTTTIGKLAKQFQNDGLSVMLAAGDTFRAAAVEQLQVWGERNDIPVVAQGTGADSASVIYDAMESAKAKNIDILLADTAGRLHTQTNLMEELKKVKRVIQKINPDAPHEIMLIVDASIGQNALAQATEFDAALGLTGITVTKLDGTAKGGILFAMAEKTGIPVRFIGVGESIDDLQEFDAYEFTGALLANEEQAS